MSRDRGRPERRFWGPDVRKDVDDELAYHLELQQREDAAKGLTARAAREAAEHRFGNLDAIAGACREIDNE